MEIQKELERVGKEFALKVLTKLKEVKAIAFEGAVARGLADKYSDIDIICLCDKIPAKQKRTNLLHPLVSKLNQDYKSVPKNTFEDNDFLEYKGKSIGVAYKKISKIKQLINKFRFKVVSKEELGKIVTKVYYTKIIYDPKKTYFRLRTSVPKSDVTKIVEPFLYYLSNITLKEKWPKWGLQAALYRKNLMEIDGEFQEATDFYLKLLYAINGEYFFVPKWAHKSIKKLKIKPKNCWERIQAIFRLGNDPKSIKKKVKIFQGLMGDLYTILKKEGLR